MQFKSRRDFLRNSTKAGLAITAFAALPETLTACGGPSKVVAGSTLAFTGFDQTPLPYDYKALEPVIDAATMELHYSKHAAGYAKNVKEAAQAEGVDASKPLEDALTKVSK